MRWPRSRDPEISQNPGNHLTDGPDSIRKLLFELGHHAAMRMELGGSEIQEMYGDALPHRAECIDRRLLQRLVKPAIQFFAIAQATRASRRAAPLSAGN